MVRPSQDANDLLIKDLIQSRYYRFTDDGNIFTLITRTGKVSTKNQWRLAGHRNVKCNNINISYKVGLKRTKLLAHRIIYAFFNGELISNSIVYHLNGDGLDNRPSNLAQGTQSEAAYLAFRTRRKPVFGNVKLKPEDVKRIRYLWRICIPNRVIREEFKISKSHVSMIVNKKIWKDL